MKTNKMKIPASYHQERLWFIDTFEAGNLYPSGPVYHNIPILLSITGPLDHRVLEQSIREVIHRHEALRTHIITVDNKPIQSIDTSVEFHLMISEITDNTTGNEQTGPVAVAIEESQRPFLMDKEPLIRARLFQINSTDKKDKTSKKSLLLITLHHMIADHHSLGIVIREMLAFYNSHLEGDEPRLPKLSIQYADFSQWQRQMPAAALKSLLRYWKGQLKGEIQPLELPTDRARAAVHIFHAARQPFTLDESTAGAVGRFAQEQGVGKEAVLLAVFNILLHRYSGQEEVVVGISTKNRTQPGTDTIIGPIANLLPIRTQVSGKSRFHTLLSKINRTAREALKYRAVPFDRLVMEINPHKDMSRTALFDVLFRYEENPFEWPAVKDLKIERVEINLGWGKYDLNLVIQNKEEEKSFTGIMVYNSDYYQDATIERLIRHYKTLLANLLKDPHRLIDTVSLLSEEEQHQQVIQWNQTGADYADNKTIHQVFEEQVEKGGDKIAVIGMASLTYFELDEKSNQIAHLLREKGVGADTIAAVVLGRSPWMIAVLLGILKAGGAYLPIDPEYPEERIRYILSDSAAKILLTSRDNIPVGAGKQGGLAPIYLPIEDHLTISPEKQLATRSSQLATSSVNPESLAYIIYTSGTTGRPKGCTISHKNVLRLLTNNRQPVVFNDDDVWVMAHSYCFDFSVWEMYGALLCGGRLVIPSRQTVRDTAAFLAFIKQSNVTVLNQTPAAFYHLTAEEQKSGTKKLDRHLRMVIFGGDKLEPAYLKSWTDMYPLNGIRLVNMYGITETTIHVTHYTLRDEDITAPAALSPIGVPLPETTVYIFNSHLQLQPALVTGELYVGGSGVSRGYLNNSKLTHSRFLENPYKTGEILYRTGDLGRWLPDGSIRYVGRMDHQVQVRGFRIEMGEIESQLLRHEHIKEAVVTDREKGGDKYLCAYIVPHTSSPPTAAELRRCLSNTLPEYMIPSFFVVTDKIPLTANGKVDRKSLPEPEVGSTDGEYTSPRDAVEDQLAEIWSEVLGIRRDAPNGSREIGIDDNFFELGGHSLKAVSLVSKIHKEFNSKISIGELFSAPTIRELAGHIRDAKEDKFIVIDPVEKKEYYPLSPAQNRLYILHRMDEITTGYNVPLILTVEGTLDKERLEGVFYRLIQRHESLRTSFEIIDGEPIQKIYDYDDIEFAIEVSAAASHNWNNPDFVRPFDLSRAPLLRVGWRKIEEKKHILMVDMHHIITDGTSQNILMEEFKSLSTGKELPPLRLRYKDYSQWQRGRAVKEAFKQQEGYWLHEMEGEIPVLNMPFDYPRPTVQGFEGKTIGFEIGAKETTKLNEMAGSQEATLFMVLLGIYNIFLSKISGREDIVVGTPIAGRKHADLEQIIGMLVNTLALRNYPSGNMTFNEFLRTLRQGTLRAYENQEYQFEQLVEKAPVERDLSRNPLFDVMFIFQNMFETPGKINKVPGKEIGDLKISLCPYENKTSKVDLTITAMEKGEKLHFYFEYCTKLFEQETIRRFIGYFKKVLSSVIRTPGKKISGIEIIPGEEKRKVLHEFNDTAAEYPGDKTIHELFEEQVRRTPGGIALRSTHRAHRAYMTYNQLNKKSNRLAHHLRGKGVGPDCLVGIILERSAEIMVAILGIMKAGGAYLPMDPDYPAKRINYMLEDSAASIVLTVGNPKELIGSGCEILEIENNDLYREDHCHLEQINKPIDLAYVIYTSGSTGKPKGVMIEHRSLANFIKGMTGILEFTGTDSILSLTTISFDIFGLETILPLTKGSRVVMGTKEEQLNPAAAALALDEEDITILQVTPARLALLLSNERSANGLKHLKYLLVGGEVFPGQLLGKTREVAAGKIFNLYGPTETTIWSTVKEVSQGETLNIGKPTANTRVYIMNGSRSLQPVGIFGELWISGAGLARGYINRGELTNRKFINDPNETGEYMYHTGDIARWLPDGNIEFLGRKDNQVKIRGFRIELSEIENHLKKYKEIQEAVVLDREDRNGDRHLCAYVVTVNEHAVPGLREYLSQHLPNYMIPTYFVKLDKIPLTPNGKTDRKALPEPSVSVDSPMYIAPQNENEEKLVELWATVLGIKKEKIGVNDNFFDRGGSSLTIIRLAGKMEETLDREIPVTMLFRYPTIRALSEYLDRGGVPGETGFDTEKLDLIRDSIRDTLNIFGDD